MLDQPRFEARFTMPHSPESWTRRRILRAGVGGLAAWLASRAGARGDALAATPARARAVVVLYMIGGPSHLDTFDPKPGTRAGGPFKTRATSVKGIEIVEHLPRVAAQAHRLAIVRGMTSREGNHARARYLLHTGYSPNPTVQHPALGAWVAEELARGDADLPAFVSLGGPSAGAGFLGRARGPLVVEDAGALPPNTSLAAGVDDARFERRRAALQELEHEFAARTRDAHVAQRRAVIDQSIRMMRSPHLGAFDVSREPEGIRASYGDTDFGRGCLVARRLVEAGVRFVEVALDGWDTHEDNFTRVERQLATLDPAMGALLDDLTARGLLDSTLVVWLGDFGRTPAINAADGRDHHPGAWSAVLAGGGIRGGIVHGRTDDEGSEVVAGAVSVPDLFATIADRVGIDPGKTFDTPLGRPIAITDRGRPVAALLG
jgi:uncharacterized protein (DUF1501 family)